MSSRSLIFAFFVNVLLLTASRVSCFTAFVSDAGTSTRTSTAGVVERQGRLPVRQSACGCRETLCPSLHGPSGSCSVSMISNPFAGLTGNTKKDETFPKDVKDAVSRCRASVQEALKNRISRMDVEMPVGAKFGVEKRPKRKSNRRQKGVSGDADDEGGEAGDGGGGGPTRDQLETSDRELARLFVEMFQPVGGNRIAVVFREAEQSDLAKKVWKSDPTAICQILSLDRRRGGTSSSGKKKKKKGSRKKAMGFAAKLAADLGDDVGSNVPGGMSGPFRLPSDTEVALFVAPGPKELVIVERICSEAGMGTLVVLLNARLSTIESFGREETKRLFLEEFESVFALAAAPQDVAPGCLFHRSFPNDWLMARKPAVGPPRVVLSQKERPNSEECKRCYDNLEIGEIEKGVESVIGNVAGWFT